MAKVDGFGLTAEAVKSVQFQARRELEQRRRRGALSAAVECHTAYRNDPIGWASDKLGIGIETLVWSMAPEYEHCDCKTECCTGGRHQWDGDPDPMVKLFDAVAAGDDVGVEGGTGTGKSMAMAILIFWFLACFEDSIVVTVAPKAEQLTKHIWKEVGGLWSRFEKHFPQAELLTGLIRMRPPDDAGQEKWAASAFVCGVGADEKTATKARGFHGRHMLIITEETPGIHPAIMRSLDHTRTAKHNLQCSIGNPEHQHDELHKFCVLPSTTHIRASTLDHPNIVTGRDVVPGTHDRARLAKRIASITQREYQSNIRGISPGESEDALIQWDWCVEASKRWGDRELRSGVLALGVDVADSPTGDPNAISRWDGACCTEVQEFRAKNASEVGQMVFTEIADRDNPINPRHVGIDSIGVGASAVNKITELGIRIRRLNGSERVVAGIDVEARWAKTAEADGAVRPDGPVIVQAEAYANLRSAVYWRLREDLRLGRIALPHDLALFSELTAIEYEKPGGKITIKPKDDIKKVIGRSPNKADAVAYGNYVRPRRPPKAQASATTPQRTRDRDTGLEEHIARIEKQQRKARKQTQRILKRLQRAS